LGEAAAKLLNAKTAVVGYTDFPPGKDSLAAFKRSFEANGGKVVDEIPMGGGAAVPDFTPFFQRAKDKKPDVFFVFVPAGDHATAVVKTYVALGMREAGIRLIGPGDITQDTKLQAMGPAAVGYHLTAAANLAEIVIVCRADSFGPGGAPRNFTVQWSDDGVTYTDAWSVTNQTAWAAGETRIFAAPAAIVNASSIAAIPIGGAGLIVAFKHEDAGTVEPAVTRAIEKVVGEAEGRHVQALKGAGAGELFTVNVLEDPEVRANLPRYSNWPTFPQLFINGELIGGCDIVTELYESGELARIVAEAGKA